MTTLARRLGVGDAVVIGLGSMLGAGVFVAFAPAAAAAGAGLLIGLGIAAIVAYCNATASAQLAAQYPTSGGTYTYGRERLGAWWGFIAGWGFVIGKTASCAAIALAFAAYAAPASWERPVAALAVLLLGGVNLLGISKTALVTRILVAVVLVTLAIVVAAGLQSTPMDASAPAPDISAFDVSAYGVLQAAGLLFFALAGYARIATLGEEVRDPERTIPRAIVLALGMVVVLYATVAAVALGVLGPGVLAESTAPLAEVVERGGWSWADPIVRAGAAAASLGSLLVLMAGIGRTTLAMAREGDVPRWLAPVHPRFGVPHRAEALLTLVVVVLVLTVDLRGAIAFSSFGVLVYYAVANAAALTQTQRRYPRALQVVGLVGCLGLVVTLPPLGIAAGVAVLGLGVLARLVRRRIDGATEPPVT